MNEPKCPGVPTHMKRRRAGRSVQRRRKDPVKFTRDIIGEYNSRGYRLLSERYDVRDNARSLALAYTLECTYTLGAMRKDLGKALSRMRTACVRAGRSLSVAYGHHTRWTAATHVEETDMMQPDESAAIDALERKHRTQVTTARRLAEALEAKIREMPEGPVDPRSKMLGLRDAYFHLANNELAI